MFLLHVRALMNQFHWKFFLLSLCSTATKEMPCFKLLGYAYCRKCMFRAHPLSQQQVGRQALIRAQLRLRNSCFCRKMEQILMAEPQICLAAARDGNMVCPFTPSVEEKHFYISWFHQGLKRDLSKSWKNSVSSSIWYVHCYKLPQSESPSKHNWVLWNGEMNVVS
jgi:hypothetical protein